MSYSKNNEINLSINGNTIQATPVNKLTPHDKILLINIRSCHHEKNVIDDMIILFGYDITPFYDTLYELVKPNDTKTAIKT
jgi:hypothetical protein